MVLIGAGYRPSDEHDWNDVPHVELGLTGLMPDSAPDSQHIRTRFVDELVVGSALLKEPQNGRHTLQDVRDTRDTRSSDSRKPLLIDHELSMGRSGGPC